jgi:hypothetical protein
VRAALAQVAGDAPVRTRLVSSDQQSATCAYRAGAERVTVEVDSVPQAYMYWETVNVHQVQANVGRSGQAKANEYPQDIHGVGVQASWIPSEHQLIATNATRTRGGAFVRVTIRRRAAGAPGDRAVARSVAGAALRSAPRGPA